MTRPINGILVWADGRREPTNQAGGIKHYYPRHLDDGRSVRITFEATGVEGDAIVYEEREAVDISKEMAEAGRRIEERRWKVICRGLGWRR